MKQPKISLVGAGPGDPELLTLKAVRTLQRSDVVLYDALVNPSILEWAPVSAPKVFVGKRAGKKRYTQDEINLLMVQYAFSHGHVVRLKGGDPFVFGRGYEELEYARAFDIQSSVVPGISSANSLAALQGVPVTSRGFSESFWVITGTTKTGQLSSDIRLAAQSTATVVVLMGMNKLPEIARLFIAEGRPELPVMVIQNGSREDERFVLGKINTIVEKVQEQKISTPGVIVIGETVQLHAQWPAAFRHLNQAELLNKINNF